MKKVTIEPGCITCGACEFVCPAVFKVTDICHVQEGADLEAHRDEITLASAMCPVQVIKVEE